MNDLRKIHKTRTWTYSISRTKTFAPDLSITLQLLRSNSYRLSQRERRANRAPYLVPRNYLRIEKQALKRWLKLKNMKNTKAIRNLT